MTRTTVYLPIELKRALQRAAADTGRSEAEIIREGIRLAVETRVTPAPSSGIFRSGIPNFAERADELLATGFGRD